MGPVWPVLFSPRGFTNLVIVSRYDKYYFEDGINVILQLSGRSH